MSRSNPHEHGAPNPAARWFEWHGGRGCVSYYDKEAKKDVDVAPEFRFMLLDQLGSVRGWHDPSKSGIYSNEVRDTRQDVLLVKAFKGGTLAEGVYQAIKDRVNTLGGSFVANCYIAAKLNGKGDLSIASLRFKGSALGAWMEFCKTNRATLYKKAIAITGSLEGRKGGVMFKVPTFKVVEISPESDAQAMGLDKELQEYLTGYLKRTKRDQAEYTVATQPGYGSGQDDAPRISGDDGAGGPSAMTDDDIPF